MSKLYKIQVSKDERRMTINAIDLDMYITEGWIAETEQYIGEPAGDKIEAQVDDEADADAEIDEILADVDADDIESDIDVNAASNEDKATGAASGVVIDESKAVADDESKAAAIDGDLLID